MFSCCFILDSNFSVLETIIHYSYYVESRVSSLLGETMQGKMWNQTLLCYLDSTKILQQTFNLVQIGSYQATVVTIVREAYFVIFRTFFFGSLCLESHKNQFISFRYLLHGESVRTDNYNLQSEDWDGYHCALSMRISATPRAFRPTPRDCH